MAYFSVKRSATAAAAALAFVATPTLAEISMADIKNGYREHAAMAQFHRWYQVYERPAGGIENALDILAQDVVVKSSLGEANGHDDYKARVMSLPDTWQNAHFVNDVTLEPLDNGDMQLTADVTYYNTGYLPDGATRAAELDYSVQLTGTDTLLPVLQSVEITPKAEIKDATYQDAYAENRMLSLVHYWLAIIEDPKRDPAPFKDVLADEIALNFSSGTLTDYDGLATWLITTGAQVAASTHVIGNFDVQDAGDDLYIVTVEFDWAGVLPNDAELIAKTRHTWTVENDVTERFARIHSIDVEVLEPFRPKTN